MQAYTALLGAAAAPPAPPSYTHTPLCCCCDPSIALHFTLAERALSPAGLAGWAWPRPSRLLRGDGAKDVVPFPEEVSSSCAQSKAALPEDHTGTGGLGRARPLVVLQLR